MGARMDAATLLDFLTQPSHNSHYPFPRLRWLDLRALKTSHDSIRSSLGQRWSRVGEAVGSETTGEGSTMEVLLAGPGAGSMERWTSRIVADAIA